MVKNFSVLFIEIAQMPGKLPGKLQILTHFQMIALMKDSRSCNSNHYLSLSHLSLLTLLIACPSLPPSCRGNGTQRVHQSALKNYVSIHPVEKMQLWSAYFPPSLLPFFTHASLSLSMPPSHKDALSPGYVG